MMKRLFIAALFAASTMTSWAGGLLTNTNQNITFLRNPARDGAIGIDGVYSNPAGVIFLGEGIHLSLNWQAAWQTRSIDVKDEMLAYGYKNNGLNTKHYEGKATAPVIPSLQAAYNTDKWSFMFNFAVNGGGGKCEFSNGLGSFEKAVGTIGYMLNSKGLDVTGYDANYYMQGKQFYYGFTLGAAHKITDNLSVYAGARVLYGSASYKATISNIAVNTSANGLVPFGDFLAVTQQKIGAGISQYDAGIANLNNAIAQMQAAGLDASAYQAQLASVQAERSKLVASQSSINALEVYSNGVNLQSNQTGIGIAPIFGIDYKLGNFNFAGKYEFRTKMSMKNTSTLQEAMIPQTAQFVDGTSIREDSPALLALGAQWEAIPGLRVNAGYHHFYDKQSKKFGDKQKQLKNGTNEYLGGVEYDINDKITVSGGTQITKYGLTDEYMSDLSFVVDSWSFGLGMKYKVSDKVAINAAYFKTNYSNYKTSTIDAKGNDVINDFTRTNDVVGVGVDFTF